MSPIGLVIAVEGLGGRLKKGAKALSQDGAGGNMDFVI